jgi:hypothetical protein
MDSFSPLNAMAQEVSAWIWSWFDEFDYNGKGVRAEADFINLGWNGLELRRQL